jgi:galactokinase
VSNIWQPRSLTRALLAHRAVFGATPTHQATAPGRINLIGEHTDYNSGLALPIAIRHRGAAVLSRRTDSLLRFVAADLPAETNRFEFDLRDIRPEAIRAAARASGGWPAYVAGPAALLAAHASHPTGADITVCSDVPPGAGLSSSAAAEVPVAGVLCQLWNVHFRNSWEFARICQRAEHEFAGVPCGLMDQLVATCPCEGHALLIDFAKEKLSHVPVPGADRLALIVANSGVRHTLASGEYARRRAMCESAALAMGLGSLRDASIGTIAAASLSPEQRDCATHVVRENDRVRAFVAAISTGNLAAAGALMFASHESLRDLYRVSCPELDTLVEIAREVPGVYGSRMTGGGFGGCTITLCEPAAVERHTRELHSRYRAAHNRDCTIFSVRPSASAHVVDANDLAH